MKKLKTILLFGAIGLGSAVQSQAQDFNKISRDNNKMLQTKKILKAQDKQNNSLSVEKKLVEAIKETKKIEQLWNIYQKADLNAIAKAEEQVTFFLPLDNALEFLSRKERKDFLEKTSSFELKRMFSASAIAGRQDIYAIKKNIELKGGTIEMRTLSGDKLFFFINNDKLYVKDSFDNLSELVEGDYYHENGFFHFVNDFIGKSFD